MEVPFRVKRAVAAVLAWAAFGAAWLFVAQQPGAVLLSWQLLTLPGSVLSVAALNAFWVRHNRRIYDRKGPRRGLPVVEHVPTHDRLDRPLRLDVSALRVAREVVVDLDSAGKTYRVVS